MTRYRTSRTTAWVALALVTLAGAGLIQRRVTAADHRDSTTIQNDPAADIADVYVFNSPGNPANVVLAMTVSGLLAPAESDAAFFDPGVLYEFKIDLDGDAVEDRVIQAFATGQGASQRIHVRGPAAPTVTGTESRLLAVADAVVVDFSGRGETQSGQGSGMQAFAGLRDDPFFFDLGRFNEILAGNAPGFRDPGVDTFAGTNALAIVVEVPVAMIGATRFGVWGTTSR